MPKWYNSTKLAGKSIFAPNFNLVRGRVVNLPKQSLLNRLGEILVLEYNSNSILLGTLAILMSIGFFVSNSPSASFNAAVDLLSAWQWSVLFISYGTVKVIQSISRIPFIVKFATGVLGTWMWSYLFLSSVLLDASFLAPSEMLYLLPILSELWELSMSVVTFKTCPARRKREL